MIKVTIEVGDQSYETTLDEYDEKQADWLCAVLGLGPAQLVIACVRRGLMIFAEDYLKLIRREHHKLTSELAAEAGKKAKGR